MIYILANTQQEGKRWAKGYLSPEEKYKVLSTNAHLCGKVLFNSDCLYLTTQRADLITALLPALCGCSVYSIN